MSKIKRKRRPVVFIGILHNKDDDYVELIAKNLAQANVVMETEYPGEVKYVYKSSKHSGSNLNKIKTINCADYIAASISFITGDLKQTENG